MNEPDTNCVVSARQRACGREIYSLESAAQSFLLQGVLILRREFGFQPAREPNPDGWAVRGRINSTMRICASWTDWFGFQIAAEHERSNAIVTEIADYFDRIKNDPDLAQYFSEPSSPD